MRFGGVHGRYQSVRNFAFSLIVRIPCYVGHDSYVFVPFRASLHDIIVELTVIFAFFFSFDTYLTHHMRITESLSTKARDRQKREEEATDQGKMQMQMKQEKELEMGADELNEDMQGLENMQANMAPGGLFWPQPMVTGMLARAEFTHIHIRTHIAHTPLPMLSS